MNKMAGTFDDAQAEGTGGNQVPVPASAQARLDHSGRRFHARLVLSFFVLTVVVGMALAGVTLLTQGAGEDHDLPEALAASGSAESAEQPDEVASNLEPEDTEHAATALKNKLGISAFAAPEQEATAEQTATAAQEERNLVAEPLQRAEALNALTGYLATALQDPSAGWKLLTPARQAHERWADYEHWWSNLTTARVSNCRYDEVSQLAVCDLATQNHAGQAGLTPDVSFQLVREGKTVKLGIAEESASGSSTAAQELAELRETTLASTAFDGRWVAVLSAKREGTTDHVQMAANGTNTFFLPDILAMHHALTARLTNTKVLLLRSGDWAEEQGDDLWFTVADGGFASADDVKHWCEKTFPELAEGALKNQCLPRQLLPAR